MAVLMSSFVCPSQEAKRTTAEASQAWTCSCSGEQSAGNQWEQESREHSLARQAVIGEYEGKAEERKPCYSYHIAKEISVVP